jgi:putative protease
MPKPKKQKPIGKIIHYYNGIKVAIVKFNKAIRAGKELHYRGTTTDFKAVAKSIQFDHKEVKTAKKGQKVGIKVKNKVREGDEVFEVI